MGTEKSKGTKVFALGGKVNNTGLVEIPMGTTLREIVYDIGGGIPGGKKFKAAQTGGPSGGCLTEADLDAQIDDVSLVRCRDEQDDAPSLPRGLRIDVAKGAQLLLDYPGVAACGPVSYDGQVYVGMLDRTTHPAFITGPGTLRAIPSGSVLLVR